MCHETIILVSQLELESKYRLNLFNLTNCIQYYQIYYRQKHFYVCMCVLKNIRWLNLLLLNSANFEEVCLVT